MHLCQFVHDVHVCFLCMCVFVERERERERDWSREGLNKF